MIVDGLRTWLIAQPAVAALVGIRVYPNYAPQTAPRPFVKFKREHEDKLNALDGTGGFGDTASAVFDLECIADTPAAATALANAIGSAIKNHTGAMGNVTCEAVIIEDEYDGFIKPTDGSDSGRHVTTLEFTIFYK